MSQNTTLEDWAAWGITDYVVLDQMRADVRRGAVRSRLNDLRRIVRKKFPELTDAEVRDKAFGLLAML